MIERRYAIMNFLKECGIETKPYFYPPVHAQAFFQRFADRPLPTTENVSRRVITLPFYTTITEEEIDYIVKSLMEAERSI
jgi:perosamine synthetase